MTVLHFWALAVGAVAVAAPLAVHFLTKPKPVAFRLSTLRFLQEVIEQRRARSRIRDWLILLLRALCVALLAFAISRPLLDRKPVVPTQGRGDTARLVILDVSQSMSAGNGGVTALSLAQASALQYLQSRPGMTANVVFAGARAHGVFDQLSPNLPSLREAVRQVDVRAERADARGAIELAGRMLSQVEGGQKELVVISDFQRTNWGTLFVDLIPRDTKIQFHSVSQPLTGNIAITSVRFASEPVVGQAGICEVEIANYSDREVNLRCRVGIGGKQRTMEATLSAQGVRTFSESMAFDQPGWKSGWVTLENNLDMLPDDDARPVAVHVRPPIRAILVSRQSGNDIPSSSFYLEHALRIVLAPTPSYGAEQGSGDKQSVARVHPARKAAAIWPECDVYVLDHPGALSDETLQLLASRLRRGRGLLYVTSELVDAANLKQLAEILGSDFQPPVTMYASRGGQRRKDLFVSKVKERERPFDVLGGNLAPLRMVRFSGGLATRETSEGLRDHVLAELSDTSALLYLSEVGAGQFAVLNADLDESNWCVQPTFLPVLGELVQQLLSGRGQNEEAYCGEPLVRMLPPEVSSNSRLVGKTVDGDPPQDDRYGDWAWSASQDAVVWNWTAVPGPGVYALNQGEEPVSLVATSSPAVESDLQALDETFLTERIATGHDVGFVSAATQDRHSDTMWKWFIVACLLGLLGEIVALRGFQM